MLANRCLDFLSVSKDEIWIVGTLKIGMLRGRVVAIGR
jgi:hypothetical protein